MPVDYRVLLTNTDPEFTPMQQQALAQQIAERNNELLMAPLRQRQAELGVRSQELANTNRELDNQRLQDQENERQLYRQGISEVGADPSKLMGWGNGKFSLDTMNALQKQASDAATAAALQREREANATKIQRDLYAKDLEDFGQDLRTIRKLPEGQRLPAWRSLVDRAAQTKNPLTGKPYTEGLQLDRDSVLDDHGLIALERAIRGDKSYEAADKVDSDAARKTAEDQDKDLQRDLTQISRLTSGIDPASPNAQQQLDVIRQQYAKSPAAQYIPQQATAEALTALQRMGMTASERVQADKTPKESNPTEASLAQMVARGSRPGATAQDKEDAAVADAALKRISSQKAAERKPDAPTQGDKEMSDAQKRLRQNDIREIETKMSALEGDNVALNQLLEGTKGRFKNSDSITFKGNPLSVEEGRALVDQNVKEYKRLQSYRDQIASDLNGGSRASAAPKASKYSVGQTVKLKDGSTVTIKKINSDGTFEY